MTHVRIVGLTLGVLATLSVAGCLSENKTALRDMLQASLPEALESTELREPSESPRLARMQQAAPLVAQPVGGQGPPTFSPRSAPPQSAPPQDPPRMVPPPATGAQQQHTQPVNYRPADTTVSREILRVNIRARVNGKPIFDDEIITMIMPELYRIRRMLQQPQRSEKETELFNATLDKMIEEEVVYQDAIGKLEKNNKRGLDKLKELGKKEFQKKLTSIKEKRNWTDVELAEQLKREGLTLVTWEEKEERDFVIREYMRSRIHPEIQKRVSHADIREYYDQHRNEFQQVDKVTWQNLFIAVGPKNPTLTDAHQTAQALIERWRNGEELANLLAFNDGPNRTGEGYGSRRGEIKPAELEDYLFSMKEGDIGPAVRLPAGVHIFRVTKRDFAGLVPFNEEVQKTIRRKLSNDVALREEKRIIQELKARAVIEINP